MALPSAGFDKSIYQAPSGDITDFTLIVNAENFSADYKSDVNSADGTRARFAKNVGAVEIPFDFIDFVDSPVSGWARMFIGNSFTADTDATRTIRAYSPNTRNIAYIPSDTFGSDNAYDSSWELYIPFDGDFNDRTSNSRDGTGFNSPTLATGKVGQAVDLDGSTQGVTVGNGPWGIANAFTFSAWIDLNASGSQDRVIIAADHGSVGTRNFMFRTFNGLLELISWDFESNLDINITGSANLAGAGFTYVTATFDTSVGAEIEYNLNSEATDASTAVRLDNASSLRSIGLETRTTYGGFFYDHIDEVQVHSANRNADWRAEEYAQTNNNTTFWDTWVFTPAGGVTHQLAGSLNSTSQLTGLLNLTQRLSGSLNTASQVSGIMRLIHGLSGSLNSVSSTSGSLRLIQRMSASLNSSSVVSGTLRLIHGLSGSVQSASQVTGTLRLIQRLRGLINSKSQITGNLTIDSGPVTHQLSGSILSRSQISGTLADDALTETLFFNGQTIQDLDFTGESDTELDYNGTATTELSFTGDIN